MFISHLLATRKVEANQGTQANEGREVENEENVFCHIASRSKDTENLLKIFLSYRGLYWLSNKLIIYLILPKKHSFLHKMEKLTTKLMVIIKLLLQIPQEKVSF